MKKKSSFGKIVILLLVLFIGSGVGFVYFSPMFEKNKPVVKMDSKEYWNLKSNLNIEISDESGIKYYKVIFKDGAKEVVLDTQILPIPKQELKLEIAAPKIDMFFKSKEIQIVVEAIDSSKWNLLEGNNISKTFNFKVDRQNPINEVVENSYAIRRGGSALVVVKVQDENLEDAYISFNDEKRFELIPFAKENYYVSVIAWPVEIEDFKIVNLVATDKAQNISITKVPLYIRPLKEKSSDIKISDNYIENISKRVLRKSGKDIPTDYNEIFLMQNKLLRALNVDKIKNVSKNNMNRDVVFDFSNKPFKRLKNSITTGHYAQKRSYYIDDLKIDEAWHLGIDWASVKRADIKTSNAGRVIYNDYLGIYGNTVIIDHGFGIQSLYAHLSSSSVNLGEMVKAGQTIGNTGNTGASMGDHLHFGVLVQGIEVNPLEWMDKSWIKTRVSNVLNKARKEIGK